MIEQPLFWLYLFLHFQIFIFLMNRIGIRDRRELPWTLLFLSLQVLPSVGLARAWDFRVSSWAGLSWAWKLWLAAAAAWVLWLWIVQAVWVLFRSRRVPARLLSDRKVRHSFAPPWAWLSRLGIRNQFYDLHAATWEVFLPGWPREFDGLSVVQVSDVHQHLLGAEYLERVREVARSMKPDLFVFTGDFVTFERNVPEAMAWLRGWTAPMGRFGVLGNHDYWTDLEGVRKGLKRAGIRILQNETVTLRRRGKTLALMGVDDPWTGKRQDERLDGVEADARILLAHQPDHFYLAKRLGAHLQLSGHTHGGQIRFPLLGPLIVPTDAGRRFAAGFIREGKTTMFINRGLGAFPPVRILCPPEVVKIILRTDER